MEIEQLPPNGPNFLLIVILAGIAMLVIFVIIYGVLHWDHHIIPHHVVKHTSSKLVMPVVRRVVSVVA